MKIKASLIGFAFAASSFAVHADVGRAGFYQPPYLPTKCYGNDTEAIRRTGGYFVAVSGGLWDNGAACGRRYVVRCISARNRACVDTNRVIMVTVVDRCKGACSTTEGNVSMKLPTTIAHQLAKPGTKSINIEYAER